MSSGGVFLQSVGAGRLDAVRAMLDAEPHLVNAVGPHPFWGGRPQALHVAIESGRRDVFDLLRGWADTSIQVTNNARCAEVVRYLEGLGAPI